MASLILVCPVFVLAHASLLRVDPAADTTVAKLPSELHLWFSESLERRFSQVTVYRATRDTATGKLQLQERVEAGLSSSSQVTRELVVKLPSTLPPSLYLVQWKVLSIDAHRTTGQFTLTYAPSTSGTGETERTK
jgi:methionine-rich copper-binding protein CopC